MARRYTLYTVADMERGATFGLIDSPGFTDNEALNHVRALEYLSFIHKCGDDICWRRLW